MSLSIPEFTRLIDAHGSLVLATAFKILHDRHQADDVFCRTSWKAWIAWQVQLPDCVAAWLRKVAAREALQIRRELQGRGETARKDVTFTDDLAGAAEHENADRAAERVRNDDPVRAAEHNELRQLIERLPEQQKRAVGMRFFEGANYDMIADALQVPRGSVGYLLKRGFEQLRRWLGDEPGSAFA